jgi:hypothetical protein
MTDDVATIAALRAQLAAVCLPCFAWLPAATTPATAYDKVLGSAHGSACDYPPGHPRDGLHEPRPQLDRARFHVRRDDHYDPLSGATVPFVRVADSAGQYPDLWYWRDPKGCLCCDSSVYPLGAAIMAAEALDREE